MARFTIKALAVAALVCLVVDLAASDSGTQYQQPQQPEYQEPHKEAVTESAAADVPSTTPSSSTFKDKLKGFVSSVKEGTADAYESVSDTVSGAAHSLDDKRKEVVAGTKKLVNTAIDKIKTKYDSFKSGEKNVSTASPAVSSEESGEQHAQSEENSKNHEHHP